jgi:serine/threonine-protein kinase
MTGQSDDHNPLWTPDGERVVFGSNREGSWGLFWMKADGTGEVERLMTDDQVVASLSPYSWSPDAKMLVFHGIYPGRAPDIGVLSMEDRAAELRFQTEFVEAYAAVSPDGRWLAYMSNRSGQFEVYVERFPELGARRTISTGGGSVPLWSPDGRELFYLEPSGTQLMAVPVTTGRDFNAGTPKVLFEGAFYIRPGSSAYDITPDGKRFLIISQGTASTTESSEPPNIIVVQNWLEELKRLVPR